MRAISWIVFALLFVQNIMMMLLLFFFMKIINQSNQNIEELIIGEYSQNDINSPGGPSVFKNLAANLEQRSSRHLNQKEVFLHSI